MRKGSLFLLCIASMFLMGGGAWYIDYLGNDWSTGVSRYIREGRYEKGIPIARQALQVAGKRSGREHPVTARSLNTLALLLCHLGRYPEAEPLYHRALAIREKALGPEHTATAVSLDNLSVLFHTQGRYADAEQLCRRALAIREKKCGPGHIDTAYSLNNLAGLYETQGRYSHAEPLYRRALAIYEKALGPEDPATAVCLNNLAGLYYAQGRYPEAEALYKRSLAIKEKALGPGHPDTVFCLNNLAEIYNMQDRYSDAEPLYERALAVDEKALGPGHPYTARSLNNLAVFYMNQGRYHDAEPLYQRALAIHEKALGPGHPDTAASLNNLAYLYFTRGRYPEADRLYRRALAIQEKTLGPGHHDIAVTLHRMALLRIASGQGEEALPLLERALSIDERTIGDVFTLATEKEKFAFLATVQSSYEVFLNLVLQRLKERPGAVTGGLNAVLKRKGLVLDALSRERSSLAEYETPEVKALFRKLQETSSLVSSLAMAGPGTTPVDEYRARLNHLESEREKFEKELTASSSTYARQKRSRAADCATVAGKLPPGSILVEYLCLPICDFNAMGSGMKWGGSRYCAFVLKSSRGRGDSREGARSPRVVYLGEASVIDKEVAEFRAEMARTRTLWESGILDEQAAEKRLAVKGRRLHNLVHAPVKKASASGSCLFLAPDADLNLVPFGALQDETGCYLAEKYALQYLSCGRDLMRGEEKGENNGETVIVANPDFDVTDPQEAAASPGNALPAATRGATRAGDLAAYAWKPLPGTGAEADAIGTVLEGEKVCAYLGPAAREEAVKSLRSPRRIHLATHGFFLEDQALSTPVGPEAPPSRPASPAQPGAPPSLKTDNPLLRSGLVLAGANRIGKEKPPGGGEDGVLTALEISGLPLQGTELVVLSACDTGMGKVHRGEGVFGLRRSFHLAGARTVVMSLWSVPDQETLELMTAFYVRLKTGEGKAAALRGASCAMIVKRRKDRGAAHPFFWAPFICVGE